MGLVVLRAGARRARRLLLLVGVVFAALPAGSALADTTIGQVGGRAGCVNAFNTGAMYGDLGYRVPSGGGRITGFSIQSEPIVAGYQLDFLVLRRAGGSNNYTVVGQTGPVTLRGTGLETFQVNPPGISVQGGDILGFWFSFGLADCYRFGPGPTTFMLPAPKPTTGASIAMAAPSAGADLNESANLVASAAARPPGPHFLKVTPSRTNPGKTITVSGAVGSGCQTGHKGDVAVVFSKAFKDATKRGVAGVPAVYVSLRKSKTGAFSFKLRLSKRLKTGTYSIGGRCGGRNFSSAKLNVVKARSLQSPSAASEKNATSG